MSIEVAPELARDTDSTVVAARDLHQRIALPNLYVKIPATAEGIPAIRTMISEGRSTNVTLIFSLHRYADVIEAYISGLETFAAAGGNLTGVRSVASFFVSRVDTEVDNRLDAIATDEARNQRGRAAVAQAKLAYQLFHERFSGDRWKHLAALGAHVQRPFVGVDLGQEPRVRRHVYVDSLIGPDTVNTLPEKTIVAFEDHGQLERSLDADIDRAHDAMNQLVALGIDMDDVGSTLEDEGVTSFHESFQDVLGALDAKAHQLEAR